ncbi:MAG: AHH domain-containing protein [Anaeromyxobacter sp.]
MKASLPSQLRTPAQMNTELARQLKGVLTLTLEQNRWTLRELVQKLQALPYPPPETEPEPERAGTAKETPGGHVSSAGFATAVLAKDASKYARRGVRYIKEQIGRGVYQKFDHLDTIRSIPKEIIEDVKKAAKFPGGPKHNFNLRFGMSYPYTWRAHHILPGSAFYYERKRGPCFKPEHFAILLQTDYNVNGGHNIILLPFENWAVLVHALVQHPSDHPTYTQAVMERLAEVARKIDALMKAKKHDQAKEDFRRELLEAESDFWDLLVRLGKKVTAGLISGRQYQSDFVKYATQGGERQSALK